MLLYIQNKQLKVRSCIPVLQKSIIMENSTRDIVALIQQRFREKNSDKNIYSEISTRKNSRHFNPELFGTTVASSSMSLPISCNTCGGDTNSNKTDEETSDGTSDGTSDDEE